MSSPVGSVSSTVLEVLASRPIAQQGTEIPREEIEPEDSLLLQIRPFHFSPQWTLEECRFAAEHLPPLQSPPNCHILSEEVEEPQEDDAIIEQDHRMLLVQMSGAVVINRLVFYDNTSIFFQPDPPKGFDGEALCLRELLTPLRYLHLHQGAGVGICCVTTNGRTRIQIDTASRISWIGYNIFQFFWRSNNVWTQDLRSVLRALQEKRNIFDHCIPGIDLAVFFMEIMEAIKGVHSLTYTHNQRHEIITIKEIEELLLSYFKMLQNNMKEYCKTVQKKINQYKRTLTEDTENRTRHETQQEMRDQLTLAHLELEKLRNQNHMLQRQMQRLRKKIQGDFEEEKKDWEELLQQPTSSCEDLTQGERDPLEDFIVLDSEKNTQQEIAYAIAILRKYCAGKIYKGFELIDEIDVQDVTDETGSHTEFIEDFFSILQQCIQNQDGECFSRFIQEVAKLFHVMTAKMQDLERQNQLFFEESQKFSLEEKQRLEEGLESYRKRVRELTLQVNQFQTQLCSLQEKKERLLLEVMEQKFQELGIPFFMANQQNLRMEEARLALSPTERTEHDIKNLLQRLQTDVVERLAKYCSESEALQRLFTDQIAEEDSEKYIQLYRKLQEFLEQDPLQPINEVKPFVDLFTPLLERLATSQQMVLAMKEEAGKVVDENVALQESLQFAEADSNRWKKEMKKLETENDKLRQQLEKQQRLNGIPQNGMLSHRA